MPCGTPPTFSSAVKLTSAVALNWSTVALPLPLKCIPCSVALRLAISSAPFPALARLMVSLLAVTVTVLKSLAISCVQNGKPWMVTSGLPDRASDDWTWLAILFSAYALATRSLTTTSTTITSSVIRRMDGPRLRRRRRVGATVCGSAGPGPPPPPGGGGGGWGRRSAARRARTPAATRAADEWDRRSRQARRRRHHGSHVLSMRSHTDH